MEWKHTLWNVSDCLGCSRSGPSESQGLVILQNQPPLDVSEHRYSTYRRNFSSPGLFLMEQHTSLCISRRAVTFRVICFPFVIGESGLHESSRRKCCNLANASKYHYAIKQITGSQHGKLDREWNCQMRWVEKVSIIKPVSAEVNRKLLPTPVTAKAERNLEARFGICGWCSPVAGRQTPAPLTWALRFGAWKFNQLENVSLERVAEFNYIWVSGNKILSVGKQISNCQNKCKFECMVICSSSGQNLAPKAAKRGIWALPEH